MSEPGSERALLDFGDDTDLSTPVEKPKVDTDTIRKVSENAGFRQTDVTKPIEQPKKPAAKPAKAAKAKESTEHVNAGLPKRSRKRSSKVHPFTTRLDAATYCAIYEIAEKENLGLGEVIHKAMTALNGGPLKEPDVQPNSDSK